MEAVNVNQARMAGNQIGATAGAVREQDVQTKSLSGGAMLGEGRQSAKGMMRERIAMLRREADGLEILAQSLPEVLPIAADAALWSLLVSRR